MDNCPIDLKMGKIIPIILLSFWLFSCSDEHDDLVMFKYDTEVIAVFAPNGVGDQTNAGLIYKGIVKATDSLNLSFRPIFPLTYEEGAKTIAQLTANNQPGRKRLIISTDPGYSDYLHALASDGLILDSDSTKHLKTPKGSKRCKHLKQHWRTMYCIAIGHQLILSSFIIQ